MAIAPGNAFAWLVGSPTRESMERILAARPKQRAGAVPEQQLEHGEIVEVERVVERVAAPSRPGGMRALC
jgi:hypothetical protein